MKKDLKSKANSGAKSPVAKSAPKSAVKSTNASKGAGASKAAGARKAMSTKAKAVAVKMKTPAAESKAVKTKTDKIETIKAKPAVKSVAKAKKPVAEVKQPAAKTGKRKAKGEDAAEFRINEPVLDPIGDVISGEARTYMGEPENLGKVEMDAYREETEDSAVDGTLEPGPGMTAASGTGADGDAEEDEDEENTSAARRPQAKPEQPPAKLERLQKILSQAGVASRRTAEEMIVAGQVMVNGKVVTQLGSKADMGRDHIRVNGKLLKGAERHRYYMLNKPKGYVTTVSDPEKRPTVMEFFAKTSERLYPVGRLDYQSEGLLLMTNDGELANLLTKAGSGVEKVYLVKVAGQPTEEELERLRGGVTIEKGEVGSARVRTAPARIRLVRVGENPWYEVVLTEGRNRELRKMFAAIGHFAEKIRRVEYGPLVLDMEPGKVRELTEAEVNALRLTAEGKMKPRRAKLDISLPKEAGRGAGKRGERTQWKPREGGAGRSGERGGERPRFDKRAGGPPRTASGFGARPSRPFGAKPSFGAKPEFGGGRGGAERSAERSGDRPRFDKRAGGPPRTGSGFGARPSRPFGAKPGFGAKPEFGGGRDGGSERSAERSGDRPRFDKRAGGPPRTGSGFGARPSRPFGAKPAFGARPGFGGGRDGGAGRSGERSEVRGGERKEWKPRGPEFGGKSSERPAGRFDGAARKPFRAQGERSFSKPGERPAKRFDGGGDSGRRTGSKARWVPRPGSARSEEGRGPAGAGDRPAAGFEKKRWEVRPDTAVGSERAKPANGARPGGFKRPGSFSRPDKPGGFAKPGGFSRPSGSSRPGGFSKSGKPGGGGSRGGSQFGGKRPGGR
jgi:23S rRNA pseudouridine2605 synthase